MFMQVYVERAICSLGDLLYVVVPFSNDNKIEEESKYNLDRTKKIYEFLFNEISPDIVTVITSLFSAALAI
jgi:hypothetical protein